MVNSPNGTDKTKRRNNVRKIKFPKDDFPYQGLERGGNLVYHSRIVKILKISLPSIAATAVAFLLLWPQIVEQKEMFRVGISNPFIIGKTDTLSITNSKFFSTDDKNQPFMMTSKLAQETKPGSGIINLTEPKADVLLNSGQWIVLSSKNGLLDRKNNLVTLLQEVSLYSDSGYELHTERLEIDLTANSLKGEQPVMARFPDGSIGSEGISVSNRGDIVIFTGKAKLIFSPQKPKKDNEG